MGLFHIHEWEEIARTYAPSLIEQGVTSAQDVSNEALQGVTTILWECTDKNCQELRKEKMLGKIQPMEINKREVKL